MCAENASFPAFAIGNIDHDLSFLTRTLLTLATTPLTTISFGRDRATSEVDTHSTPTSSCSAVIEPMRMLRCARMAAKRKLQCDVETIDERQQWAERVDQTIVVA
jgi:hypothetical protein